MNVAPSTQLWQTRSEVLVGGVISSWPAGHCIYFGLRKYEECDKPTVLTWVHIAGPGSDLKVLFGHAKQTASDDSVAGANWNSPAEQFCTATHTVASPASGLNVNPG